MIRTATLMGLAAALQLAWVPMANACNCQQGDAAKAAVPTSPETAPACAPTAKDGAAATAKSKAKAGPNVAEKCSCQSASDCTCKKGQCQCKQCGAHQRKATMTESLRQPVRSTKLPTKAELDASAGLFI